MAIKIVSSTKGKAGSFTNFVSSVAESVKATITDTFNKGATTKVITDSSGNSVMVSGSSTAKDYSSTSSGSSSSSSSSSSGSSKSSSTKKSSGGGYSYVDETTGKAYEVSASGTKTEINPIKVKSENYIAQQKAKEGNVSAFKVEEYSGENKVGEKIYVGTKKDPFKREVAQVKPGDSGESFKSNLKPNESVLARFGGNEEYLITSETFKKRETSLPDEQSIEKDPLYFRDIFKYSDPGVLDYEFLTERNITRVNLSSSDRIGNGSNINIRSDNTDSYSERNIFSFIQEAFDKTLNYPSDKNIFRNLEKEGKIPGFYVDVPGGSDFSKLFGLDSIPSFIKIIPDENDISIFELQDIAKKGKSNLLSNKRESLVLELQNLEKGNIGENNTWIGSKQDYEIYNEKYSEYEKVNEQVRNRTKSQIIFEDLENLKYSFVEHLPTGLGTGAILGGEIYLGVKTVGVVGKAYSKLPEIIKVGADIFDVGITGYSVKEKLTNPDVSTKGIALDIAGLGLGTLDIVAGSYPKISGYLRTSKRTEIDITELVPDEILAGEKTFPSINVRGKTSIEIAEEQLKLFEKNIDRLPGQEFAGGFHATGNLKKLEGSSDILEVGGKSGDIPLHISTDVSPRFLRIPGEETSDGGSFFESLIAPFKTSKSGVAQINPERFEINIGYEIGRGKGYKFTDPTTTGVGYIPGSKAEIEAVLQPGTKLVRTGKSFYSEYQGVRFPIDEFKVLNEADEIIIPGNKINKIYGSSKSYSGLPNLDYSAYDKISSINKLLKINFEDYSESDIEKVNLPSKKSSVITISELTSKELRISKRSSGRKHASYEDNLERLEFLNKAEYPKEIENILKVSRQKKERYPRRISEYRVPSIPDLDYTIPTRRKLFHSKKTSRRKNEKFNFEDIDDLAISQDFSSKILGFKPKKIKGRKGFLEELEKEIDIGFRKGVIIN